MTSKGVHLKGQEHLPPVLRLITDPTYQYSIHKHTIETSNDGIQHSYTVIVSREQLDKQLGKEKREDSQEESINPKNISQCTPIRNAPMNSFSAGQLVSQISSTTTSEKKRRTLSRSPLVHAMKTLSEKKSLTPPNHYFTLPSITTSTVSTEEPTNDFVPSNSEVSTSSFSSDYSSSSSLPKYTYSSEKGPRSAKYVMMVQVKFLLLHRDVFKRRVQCTFSDEFPSDCLLEHVVYNFHQLCARQLRNQNFNPRLSYCIGEINYSNSKPVLTMDLNKTLAQLAGTNSVHQFALIVDNVDE